MESADDTSEVSNNLDDIDKAEQSESKAETMSDLHIYEPIDIISKIHKLDTMCKSNKERLDESSGLISSYGASVGSAHVTIIKNHESSTKRFDSIDNAIKKVNDDISEMRGDISEMRGDISEIHALLEKLVASK